MLNVNNFPLPHTFFREPVNGLTHAAGAFLSVAGLIILVTQAARESKALHIVAFSIYGASLILLYTSSALYHLLRVSERSITLLRRIDHIMIYVLIAGTFTPICLIALPEPWGRNMLVFVWSLAALGIVFTLFWLTAPRWLYTTLYLVMGWSALAAVVPILQALSLEGLLWLLGGGMFYSVGAIIYGKKKPDPFPGVFGFHEIWHLFVMAGSFCHFMTMLQSILPLAG